MAYMIMRDALNNLLVSNLKPGTIKGGKTLERVSETGNQGKVSRTDA